MLTTSRHRRRGVAIATVIAAATCALGATAAGEQAQVGPSFKKVGAWGKAGTGNGQFGGNAYGLATDKAGNVYVADTDNHRVQVFSATGAFKRSFPFAAGESVQDVAADPDGSAWGSALQASEVRKLGGAAEILATEAAPLGIAVDADGNVYVAASTDNTGSVIRFDKTASGYVKGKTWGGFKGDMGDVEVSPDGSLYAREGLTIKRFVGARLVKTIKGGASAPLGIGVDLDCNVWFTNIAQRNLTKVSPAGKVLATAAAPDLIAHDVAVGPKGDLYAFDAGTRSVIRFAEDRSKPGSAAISGPVVVRNGKARIRYNLAGVACPAEIDAVASLTGAGISGKARVKVKAGKTTLIEIPLAKPPAKGATATFKIVLKTNGRPTIESRSVRLG